MNKNYSNLVESINRRYNPEGIILEESVRKKLSSVKSSDLLTYLTTSMNAVSESYTQKSKDAGVRVRRHLEKELVSVSYRFQGSVMTNTHIRGYSDIDLVVITEKFYSHTSRQIREIVENPYEYKPKIGSSNFDKIKSEFDKPDYRGDSLKDLKEIRVNSEQILDRVYDECDKSKAKSIRIRNKDLYRDVDIVIANWYDDIKSILNDKGDYRGIQVYDNHLNKRGAPDYPFISINLINEKSAKTSGRLKKMIRFLKNVKSDSDKNIGISSFDIKSICYDINTSKYSSLTYYQLVPVIYEQLYNLYWNSAIRDRLTSVDDRETIFKDKPQKVSELKKLLDEVAEIKNDLESNFDIS